MENKYDRQSFLGIGSQEKIENTVIGIIGISGGGSHVVQQLMHLGCKNFVLIDPDILTSSNLNRNVLATLADIKKPKVEIAKERILALHPNAKIETLQKRWQEDESSISLLSKSNIIVGCVDGLGERRDIEAFTRRKNISYVDIGMDVHKTGDDYGISGQVILSKPGGPCMWCMGYLNEVTIEKEAEAYGSAGANPQVVWPNGVLASHAVGLVVQLITGWSKNALPFYLCYDGARFTTYEPPITRAIESCSHY